jgi:hypothetical protein
LSSSGSGYGYVGPSSKSAFLGFTLEDATNTPDTINTTMTILEEEISQIQAVNKELMSRVAAIEENN